MTISDLSDVLNAININGILAQFKHFGWKTAPTGDYGVFSEDGGDQFDANNQNAEQSTTGTIDYFTRDDTGTAQRAIETALKNIQQEFVFAWNLNTIQYEQDTGYIHFEWAFSFA